MEHAARCLGITQVIRYVRSHIGNWLIYKLISNLNGLLPINSRQMAPLLPLPPPRPISGGEILV